jgi:hypothetical protein
MVVTKPICTTTPIHLTRSSTGIGERSSSQDSLPAAKKKNGSLLLVSADEMTKSMDCPQPQQQVGAAMHVASSFVSI